jgi:hypothetical protein
MKQFLVVLLLVCAVSVAFAQTPVDFTALRPAFEQFAQATANVLPFNASVGLGWSEAYVGNFPHLGLGVTVGATTIPWAAVTTIVDAFSITLPSELSYIAQFGFPLPAYTVDARIGGFGIPFDIGLKVGYVPPDGMQKLGLPLSLDYLLAGGDLRFAILDGKGVKPALSVGVGYSYMRGALAVPGLMSGDIEISPVPPTYTHTVELANPALDLSWDTNVLEVKAELSKTLLIFTPHIGAGALFSFGSHAGGGLASQLLIDGSPATQTDIDELEQAFIDAGQTPPDFTATGFLVETAAPVGWAGRVFGGLSINILVLRIDLNAMYSFPGNSYGASANLRVQL